MSPGHSLAALATTARAEALGERPRMAEIAFTASRAAAGRGAECAAAGIGLAGKGGAAIPGAAAGRDAADTAADGQLAAWRAAVLGRSVSLTLLAGSGTRWQKSLAEARARGEHASLDPARPRGLFPVRDFLGKGRGGAIPVAAYSLDAVRGLGRHVIVIRGWAEAIDAEILEPLGILPADRAFHEQEAPFGKPLGHGDAAWQSRGLWRDADYVVTNFGGDANSRHTVECSLLALDALRAAGEDVDLLMPAARIPGAAYPIGLDDRGLPRGFGHAKLLGGVAACGVAACGHADGGEEWDRAESWTNVGIRVYRAAALAAVLEELHDRHWEGGKGYVVPGNDPASRELALDNADALMARAGRARILGFAHARELSPAKSLDEVPAFEEALAAVMDEERDLGYRD